MNFLLERRKIFRGFLDRFREGKSFFFASFDAFGKERTSLISNKKWKSPKIPSCEIRGLFCSRTWLDPGCPNSNCVHSWGKILMIWVQRPNMSRNWNERLHFLSKEACKAFVKKVVVSNIKANYFSRTKVYKFSGVAFYDTDSKRIWHLTSPFYWQPHFHPELNYNTIYLVRGGNGAANTRKPNTV